MHNFASEQRELNDILSEEENEENDF